MKKIFTMLCLLIIVQAQAGNIRRVKQGGQPGGPGSDWINAYNDVQAAINASSPGDEVWIAAGTYTRGSGQSFSLRNSVRIYGGFSGTSNLETVATRNWRTNVTILQGNNASVLVCGATLFSSATSIDGITVNGGKATFGAGMFCNDGAPAFSNMTFTNNVATDFGGAIWASNFSFPITNCIFDKNQAQYGGAVYNDEAYPVIKNCVFANNTATTDGGGINNYVGATQINNKKTSIINCVFYNNIAINGGGGGVYNNLASPTIINCTFVANTCLLNTGAAVYNQDDYNNTSLRSNPVITNSAFWNNKSTSLNQTTDIGSYGSRSNVPTYISYSYFKETSTYTGTGNITAGSTSPLVNTADPDGTDNKWMTADDGLRPNLCGGLIDVGNSDAITETQDIAGQTRKFDNNLVLATGAGSAPFVDLGAYEDQTATSAAQLAGKIDTSHTVPYPQEKVPDYLVSTLDPVAGTISWQKSTSSNGPWEPATPASNQKTYALPSLMQTTYFRRAIAASAYCGYVYYTDPVEIKVVIPNGIIKGTVKSRNGAPVQGIAIQIKRLTTGISGTPDGYTYYDTTNERGEYEVNPIYYGDYTQPPVKASFRITPVKDKHTFDYSSIDADLVSNSSMAVVNFTDLTVYSLQGRTFQTCANCELVSGTTASCPLDSVAIWVGIDGTTPSFYNRTGLVNGTYGSYSVSATDPKPILIEPRLEGHKFVPAFSSFTVSKDTSSVDFRDTTTHQLLVQLSDGCSNYIGYANLEIYDVLKDADGNARPSCFRRIFNTNPNSTTYGLTLPARKYMVKVNGFTPVDGSIDLMATNVINFFNNQYAKDSLFIDLSKQNDTVNLRYQRYPVISLLSGLDTLCSNGSKRGYALMQQGVVDSFKVKIFQGPASKGCVLTDTTTKLKVFTNIPVNDGSGNVEMQYNSLQEGITVRLRGGAPNIIAPHYKTLNIQFTDRYGNVAPVPNIASKVVVTGVKADASTFTTVSPQIPMLVLHDPPGDLSYSTWQKDSSAQTAFRLYAASTTSTDTWAEVKIGSKSEAGVGVTVESEIWGIINGAVNVSSSNTTSNETILTTTATQSFSTSADPGVTGADGDVFVGSALNLKYARSIEVKYNAAQCSIDTSSRLLIANDGFATQYVYTERFIKNTLIPSLDALANNPANVNRKDSLLNQKNVWQQVLNNNAANKAKASFDKNISFDGNAGPITNQTSSAVAGTNTIEFNMVVDKTVAAQLGFEVAGSGASGGVTVAFKTEIGQSNATTLSQQTTIGYVLDDKDDGDYFSVNVKKDPVHKTPVFELAAATASCPPEQGAQPRDEMQLNIPVPSVSGVAETSSALFTFKLGNTSQSAETRTYVLALDPASNPYGARIFINGRQVQSEAYSIPYRGEQTVTVAVSKEPASPVFSYEGLRFTLSDNCTGDVKRSALISAYFVSQCSNVTLAQPDNNWTLNAASANTLPILIKDYDKSRLQSITLEYAKAGTNSWAEGFTRTADQLNPNGANGSIVNWNVTGLADSMYNLRLRLNCSQGTVYSQRSTGIIDRRAPELFGRPQPTNDIYRNGEVIAFTYNEALAVGNLNNGQVTMRRLSNNQLIPVTVTGYGNKIIITPVNSISGLAGDSVRVVVTNMADVYGNTKATPDTSRFVIGSTSSGNSQTAVNVYVQNATMSNADNGTIDFLFTIPQAVNYDRRVYYTVSGTALLNREYDTILPNANRNVNTFNGSQGIIAIPANTKQVILKIDPIFSNIPGPDKTIRISLTEGGDYTLGTSTTALGTITYNTVLPLTLISFNGKPVGDAVELQWKTSNEVNTASFTVEKSADGATFAAFTTLVAKGTGNNSYAATDANPFTGNTFYRLKMQDKDGKVAYGNVVVVAMAAKALQLISLSPSPLQAQTGKLSLITAKPARLQIVVVDIAGRQVTVQAVATTTGANNLSIELPHLQPGIYTLYAMDGTVKSNVIRFVKQ